MAITADQTQTDHTTLETTVGDIGSNAEAVAQSFTTGVGVDNFAQLDLWLFKVGNPTGYLQIDLYNVSGDAPTGASLGTSNLIPASTLTTSTSGALVNFTFPTPILGLSAVTKYVFVVTMPDETDSSNFARIMGSATSSYALGTALHSFASLTARNNLLSLVGAGKRTITNTFTSWVSDNWDNYFTTYYDNIL